MKVISLLVTSFVNDNRVYRMAKGLTAHGFSTTVVAWKKGDVAAKESFNGVEVERVELNSLRWKLPRLLLGRVHYLEYAIQVIFKYRKVDVWHCNDYEAYVIGVLAKMTRPKLKLVYDCHELESHRNGKSGFMRILVRTFEYVFIHWSKLVITVSPSIQNYYSSVFKLKNVALVRNLPNEMHISHSNTLREKLGLENSKCIFLYQGMLGKGRGVEVLLNAFQARKTNDAVIVFMGFGVLKELIESYALSNENIFFVPAVSYAEIPLYTGSADVGVNSVEPTCLSYKYSLPNKLFEYIQSEIPVITNPLPDCAALVNEYQVGKVIPSWNANGINEVIDDMLKEDLSLYQDRLKAAKKILNWECEEKLFIEAYKRSFYEN